ncbi:hybrid sensor histidine kinase/response regulator [Merismopedia glauca]|uniref:histidine kinase n=1 Tax=Merismopedia glauca CCAP 1448/3 TaxID=1296344 RepID=A0A2T1C3W9_9CYAN|nr:hybrid sensor histidine kinase/response regulator [Merismopedia glauca]PSB02975.1 hybrid sensor histidine kinase/response regulator [Merismopedia glauca CCAP 1448/3]
MAQDKEQEVKLHFLVEAEEYLDTIESGLLGLGTRGINRQIIDGILRAAHSIKGGAGMMGFNTLAQLSHRLEDFFKILKMGKSEAVDRDLETLLLLSLDRLRQLIATNRQGTEVDADWLLANTHPIFEELHNRLGDPQPEDAAALLSEEVGEDMKVLLFETEVEGCLQRLESVLATPDQPCLQQEFLITAQEFGGLGEMLELGAFTSFCQSVAQELESHPEQTEAIARLALSEWRRSQALVFVGQIAALPTQLVLPHLVPSNVDSGANLALAPESLSHNLEDIFFPEPSAEMLTFDPAEQDLFSALETVPGNIDDGISLAKPEIAQPPSLDAKFQKYLFPDPKKSKAAQNLEEQLAATPESTEQTIRVPVRQLAQLTNLFGELTIERNGLDLHLKRLRNLMGLLNQRVRVLEQSNFRLRTTHDRVATQASTAPLVPFSLAALTPDRPEFDFLEMDRYSDLHLVSQDIMETAVQIQEVSGDLQTNLEDTEKAARDINRTSKLMQNSITQLQMRPISDLVGRFSRALRDMELKYGKRVELKVRGGSTLIDRSILEALSDPLLHLFRNAFDHGIEDPQGRRLRGKPETGTIEIVAAYRGNQTAIAIRDDGRGIPLDKIRDRALQMGLEESELEAASKKELLDLIFEPGFSTAAEITDLSGRGVGMDVVRTNLREIRGDIQVDTQPGVGTTFTITVPFTLSVVRVLLVESGGLLLAFPTSAVEEMLRLHPEMILLAAGKEVLNWEGFMVPLIRLNQWLQFSSSHPLVNAETVPVVDAPTVLMVAQGEDLVGIQIDRYWGEQEVTIRQVEGNIPMPPGFTGCTILGDGRVVPLVDAIALLSWIDGNRSGQLSQSVKQKLDGELTGEISSNTAKANQKKTLLVIDDSITVRRFLALTLEKAGYRVEQAKDGREALEKLQAGLVVQAAISDIEMPRLDGYGFLAQVKSDPNCEHIPIVMLTSRSGDKHRQLAMNLGASGYFSKPFKEQELLKTIQELI